MDFSKRLDLFGPEIFAALNDKKVALEQQGKTLYNLSVGTPDFPTPPHIKQALLDAAALDENWKYSLRDLPEMLQAVCGYYRRRFGVDDLSPAEVMSFSGSQDGIGHLGLALLNEGDTVLLPDPCYPVFQTGALLGGARPWYYKLTKANGFLPDVAAIPPEVARRARVMLVSLPANPVGSVGTPALYRQIVDFCCDNGILLVHDNAYSDIVFDGARGGSIFNTPRARQAAVEFFSLSKSFNVTGARISFLVGRADVIAACKKLRTQIDFGMFLPIQKAAVAALTGPLDSVRAQCAAYQARRDALCGGLRAIGWPVPDCRGSMFVWAPLPAPWTDSMAFCLALIEKAGVISTPGASFGPSGEGYVRFALTLPVEKIRLAVAAIRDSGLVGGA